MEATSGFKDVSPIFEGHVVRMDVWVSYLVFYPYGVDNVVLVGLV